jgi:hypothetical protein
LKKTLVKCNKSLGLISPIKKTLSDYQKPHQEMKTKKIYIFILVAISFFSSCTSKKTDSSKSSADYITPIFLELNTSIPFKWPSNLEVEKITYLKPSARTAISSVDKILLSPDRDLFYVFDRRQSKIFVFDELGISKHVFDRQGEGPEEYLEIYDIQIDFEKKILEVLSYQNLKKYNLNTFEFIGTEDLRNLPKDKNFSNFIRISNVLYLWTDLPPNQLVGKEELGNYHLLRIEDGIVNFHIEQKYGVITSLLFYPASSIDEYNLPPLLGSNDIIRVTQDSVYTKFKFDFGNKGIPLIDLMNYWENRHEILGSEYYKPPQNIRETKDYLFFQFAAGRFYHNVLFDKKTESVISIGQIKDKIDPVIILSDSIYLYGYMPSAILVDYIENGGELSESPFFKDLDPTSLEKDENPIIVKFRFPYPKNQK